MLRTLLLAVLVSMSMLAAGVAVAEDTATASYTGGGVAFRVPFGFGLDAFTQFESFGGAQFTANGQEPIEVVVSDDSGVPVATSVCQDVNADLQCFPDEPNAAGCGGTIPLVGFRTYLDVIVFVGTDPACGSVATTGEITLRTA